MNTPEAIARRIEVGFEEGKLPAKDAVALSVQTIRYLIEYYQDGSNEELEKLNARLSKRLGW